jgi:hypothetical protein
MLNLFNRKRRFRETQLLTDASFTANDLGGWSVAMSADGNTAVFGAPYFTSGGILFRGCVRVWTRSGLTWSLQQQLTQPTSAAQNQFGHSVSLSSDGNTLAVGSRYTNGARGSVTIFSRSGSTWTTQATVVGAVTVSGDEFGTSVSLSGNGNKLAVGAPESSYLSTGEGIVVMYSRTGSTWSEIGNIFPSYVGLPGSTIVKKFGYSVSISGDGNTLAIGAPTSRFAPSTASQGTCHTYNISSGFVNQSNLTNTAYSTGSDYFGWSVSANYDGTRVAVGAQADSGALTASGSCAIIVKSGSTWSIEAYLTHSAATTSANFGWSVSLNNSGNILAVGSLDWTGPAGAEQGATTIFTRSNSSWLENQTLTKGAAAANDNFGYAVALSGSGDSLIVGTTFDDVGADTDEGSATIFYRR